MVKCPFLLWFFLTCLSAFAHADGICQKSSAEIIKVFNQGIVLNEKFKKSILGEDPTTYRVLRTQLEEFSEEKVIPCVERAVKILSVHNESKLAYKLLQLTVSYENSADETIAYSLGLIFGANPQVLESVLKQFSPSERKLIIERLQIGWLNTKSKFKDVIKDREQRLQKLRS